VIRQLFIGNREANQLNDHKCKASLFILHPSNKKVIGLTFNIMKILKAQSIKGNLWRQFKLNANYKYSVGPMLPVKSLMSVSFPFPPAPHLNNVCGFVLGISNLEIQVATVGNPCSGGKITGINRGEMCEFKCSNRMYQLSQPSLHKER
jgi:hypothetical protein